jgi:subtilase family serine protease
MISRKGIPLMALCLFMAVPFLKAQGQSSKRGTIVVPNSSVEHPGDVGVRAHTNFLIFVPAAKGSQPQANTGPSGETPASLSCLYQTWAGNIGGCPVTPPSGSSYSAPSGGSNVIAIVDAYDYPTACNDFNVFSTEFGLPLADCTHNTSDPHFRVVYAAGPKPAANCGWAQEEALDIEWAHAMAPNALIILVEAASNSNSDLLNAVQVASNLVAGAGGGEVSMSWGGSEFRTESTYDSYFSTPGVAYFASSGDSGGKVIWPSASANVLSAGGTSVNRDSSGKFVSETVWSSAGGGASRYIPVPNYQSAIHSLSLLLGNRRGTPDLSFDADPQTGVSVYDTTPCQGYVDWMVFGGTSVSSPSLAGLANEVGALGGGWDSGTNNASVQDAIYQIYNDASSGGNSCGYTSALYDVTSGTAGGSSATGCWDFASGVGTPRGLSGSGSTAPTVSSLILNATSVVGGNPVGGTVTLSAAPTSDASVTLQSSNTSVAAVPSSVTVTSGNTSANFTVTTYSVSASTGVTIKATYGSSSQSATLTVNPAASNGNFSVSATGTGKVSRNSTTSFTVSIIPSGGFSDAVQLSVSGVPPQSSASFSPAAISGTQTSTLTISTGSHTPTKTYTLTIIGTSGSLSNSTNVSLTVQ